MEAKALKRDWDHSGEEGKTLTCKEKSTIAVQGPVLALGFFFKPYKLKC